MFIKILGSIIVVLSSTMCGFSISKHSIKRREELNDFKKGIIILKTEIEYSSYMSDAMQIISNRLYTDIKYIFEYAGDLLKKKRVLVQRQCGV